MPTYEYECKSCSHCFETFQAMSDPPLKICPECGKEVRRLIFGGAGVIFKGSGFYVTDKSKSEAKAASSQKSRDGVTGGNSPCSNCPAGGETGKCPAVGNNSGNNAGNASTEKTKPESKSA